MKPISSRSDVLLRDACAAVLRRLPEALAVYAFGSVAEGRKRADSDLDLAVLGEGRLEPLRRLEVQRALGAELDIDVDLLDLHDASTVLQQEVVARGALLFQRDAMRVLDFEARTLSDYATLLEATQALRADIRERGRVGLS